MLTGPRQLRRFPDVQVINIVLLPFIESHIIAGEVILVVLAILVLWQLIHSLQQLFLVRLLIVVGMLSRILIRRRTTNLEYFLNLKGEAGVNLTDELLDVLVHLVGLYQFPLKLFNHLSKFGIFPLNCQELVSRSLIF